MLKKLHLGSVSFGSESFGDVAEHLRAAHTLSPGSGSSAGGAVGPPQGARVRRSMSSRVQEAVRAIALCHNVTPVYEESEAAGDEDALAAGQPQGRPVYQASSPDEVGT